MGREAEKSAQSVTCLVAEQEQGVNTAELQCLCAQIHPSPDVYPLVRVHRCVLVAVCPVERQFSNELRMAQPSMNKELILYIINKNHFVCVLGGLIHA